MKKIIVAISLLFSFGSPMLAFGATEFTSNLYYGITGNDDVIRLQEFLTEQGIYSGPITGNFYSLTLKAVKSFQIAKGIAPVSGYFGPLTRNKANTILASQGVSGSSVTTEEGTIAEVVTPPAKTTNDVVASLMAQIVKLHEQLAVMQQQQQTLQNQQQTLQTIQQEQQAQTQVLEQIQQNTVPPPPFPAEPPPPPPVQKELIFTGGTGNCLYLAGSNSNVTKCDIQVVYLENGVSQPATFTVSVDDDPNGLIRYADNVYPTKGTPSNPFTGGTYFSWNQHVASFYYFPTDSGAVPYTFCSNPDDPTCSGYRITRNITATANGASNTTVMVGKYWYPDSQ